MKRNEQRERAELEAWVRALVPPPVKGVVWINAERARLAASWRAWVAEQQQHPRPIQVGVNR